MCDKPELQEVSNFELSAMELMLMVNSRNKQFFYHKDTGAFDIFLLSSEQMAHLEPYKHLPEKDENNFRFLSYEEIGHNELMRLFVKEMIDDKALRKRLFGVLSRHEYVDSFIAEIKSLGLYNEFESFTENVYNGMFEHWAERNGLSFK